MEAAGKVATAFNPRVLKEPRGFIKFLEFILSIFAFATTTSVSTSSSFNVKCPNGTFSSITLAYSYPFDLESSTFPVPVCNASTTRRAQGFLDSQTAPAQFYVFIGVMAFLYCIAAVILYVFFDDLYRKNTRVTIVDLIITLVLAVLWLISASAWAQGVSDVKYYSNPEKSGLYHHIPDCASLGPACVKNIDLGNYASLNVSLIFGFLNVFVWAGNLWFLYKETPWFKVRSKPPTTPGTEPETDPQRV